MMEKLMETTITTNGGKQYRVILNGCGQETPSFPFHLSVQTDKNEPLGIYTDLDNGHYQLVNMIAGIIQDMGAECTSVTKIYD